MGSSTSASHGLQTIWMGMCARQLDEHSRQSTERSNSECRRPARPLKVTFYPKAADSLRKASGSALHGAATPESIRGAIAMNRAGPICRISASARRRRSAHFRKVQARSAFSTSRATSTNGRPRLSRPTQVRRPTCPPKASRRTHM